MDKSELQNWLHESYAKWEAFLDQIGIARMDEPDVAGHWSVKDIIVHLTGWDRYVVARLQAARRGEPEPPPPWSADLQNDDEINAWLYEHNHGRSVNEILADTRELFQQIFTILVDLPADTRVETIHTSDGREFYLLWIGDKRLPICEFFDHFRDDHEQEIRAWLAYQEKP
jgi:hypothetical protein